jgi:organic radical activating enzyme
MKWFSQIDITNYCHINNCVYCSRFERHIPENKRYYMPIEQIEQAIKACASWLNPVGIIGGEPQLHPNFTEICKLLLKYNPRSKYGLWTSINPKTSKYKNCIEDTFGFIAFNEHNNNQLETCKHQPLTLSSIDMIENNELRKEFQEQCYFRLKWCGTINPNGAFHCEIAGAIAYLFNIKGWDIKDRWWENDWHTQQPICDLCGGCVPQERQLICNKKQKISLSFLEGLIGHDCELGDYELIQEPYTIEYLKSHCVEKPGAYRGDRGEVEENTININWNKYEN